MAKNEPIYIPIVTAEELVKPHPIREVLGDLKQLGFIRRFKIGTDLIRIETDSKKKFEIAMLMNEELEVNFNPKSPKKNCN